MKSLLIPILLIPTIALAIKLPFFPAEVLEKPSPTALTGEGRCRVAVDPMRFDQETKWGGMSDDEFKATLPDRAAESHEMDKTETAAMFLKQLEVNEKDYLKKRGLVTAGRTGKELFVVDPHVSEVHPKNGDMTVVYTVKTLSGEPVTRFRVKVEAAAGYGLGQRLRAASAGQAWSLLQFFADRFACEGPPKVVD